MQFVVIVIVLLVVIGVFLLARSRRSNDGVEGFRREIDALSSDARRPTIDRGKMPDDAVGADADPATSYPAGEPDPNAEPAAGQDADVDAGADADTAADIDPGFMRAQDETETPEADPDGT